jgi:FSR family fosmidomycin resistance protein-like MFS transporter
MGDTHSNGRLLACFSLGHLANDWAPSTIWLIAPAIAASLALSPAEVGLLITVASVGAALGYFPAGLLADRVANRGLLLLATFWWVAIGYLVASLAPGFWSVALLFAVAGLGDAAWHPIATGVLVQALPKRRAHALGIHAMGGTFAEVLAPLSVGFLLAVFDWRTTLQVSALPALLMGLAFIRIARRVPRSPRQAISRADIRTLWRLWRLWRGPRGLTMIAMISIYNMALMAILAMTPLFLQQVHGFSPAETGIAFAAMVLAGALAQPVIGRLSDRSGRKRVFVAGNLVAVLACFAVAASAAPAAAALALVLAVGALYGIRAAVLAAVVEFSSEREATTLGFAFAVLDGVGALGALLAGAVGSLDLHYAFLLAAGFAAGAAAIAVPLGFGARPLEAKPAPGPAR